jgi:hypothetical protein
MLVGKARRLIPHHCDVKPISDLQCEKVEGRRREEKSSADIVHILQVVFIAHKDIQHGHNRY